MTIFPLAPAGLLAASIVVVVARDAQTGVDEMIVALRGAAIALTVGAAFIFDDTAAAVVESTPCPLLLRRLMRLVVVAPPLLAIWVAVLGLAQRKALTPPVRLPFGVVSLEFATIVMFTLALAAGLARRSTNGGSGIFAVSSMLVLVTATWMLPETIRPWSYPGLPTWEPGQTWWAAALFGCVVSFVCASWDGAGRAHMPHLPRRKAAT